ncbi:MAG: DUF790 family protein, partial [Myxococcota bacterium]|nr:DUF790 family protein [Myxococcota bacterium]
MLTADLVRSHVRSRQVYPRYIDAGDDALLEEATALVALFREAKGQTMGALEEAIANHIGDHQDFLFRRGLVKLLLDRTEVTTDAPADPMEVRRVVFEAAAQAWPVGHGA